MLSEESREPWASLDLRSLALFRIGLGGVLLADLFCRLPDVTAFYTDAGVLPRLLLARSEFADQWLCFHMGVGDRAGQIVLLLIQAALAAALLVGWRTRWVTLGSWVLLNSLHVRNPFVNDRGDMELALLLFWSLFLPLGARWSVDAARGRPAHGSEQGLPAAAFVAQIAFIYLFAGFLKYGEFWLVRGDGLYHSLLSPLFATAAAGWLSQAPPLLLKLLNYGVIAGEVFAGFLLLCPLSVNLLRGTAVILLLLFHLGVMILFELGLFPVVALVSLLALVPESWWGRGPLARLETGLDGRFAAVATVSGVGPAGRLLVGLSLGLALLSNAAIRPQEDAFQRPRAVVALSQALRLEQYWDLFSPIPPYNGVFEIERLEDGQAVRAVPRPEPFPNHRWRMLMIASLYPRFELVRPGLVRLLLQDEEPGGYRYLFRVRLPDSRGELGEPSVWPLWRGELVEDGAA